jgi:signal transduction histidine kinase
MSSGDPPTDLIRLLVVEDDPADAHLLAEHASASEPSIELIHVDRITDALSRLSEDDAIDAVLLDLGLPDSSGVDSLKRVVSRRPDLPVVVLTGLDSREVGIEAVQLGAEDYVVKGSFDLNAITRSVRHAIERRRLKHHLQLIVTRNADAIVVVDDDQNVRYSNIAAEELLGPNIAGRKLELPLTPQTPTEIEIADALGDLRVCELRVDRIAWEGSLAHLASIRDVTDVRRSRELERQLMRSSRLAAIGQLASGVSHEINNPISYVAANLDAVRRTTAQVRERIAASHPELLESVDEARILLDECAHGVDRIAAITAELRAFSRIEKDTFESLDINDAVRAATRLTGDEIRARARLKAVLGKLPEISGDRAKLTEAMISLLVNAAASIEPGAPMANWVRVETFERAETIVIKVIDSGRGVPRRDIERIFEPYFTTDDDPRNTGLGLSITAETVQRHGGTIEVRSELGEGTEIEIVLPTAGRVKLRLLIIDDDPVVRGSMRRILRMHHHVTIAGGGKQALEILSEDAEFDVILCDLAMPDLDGTDVYRQVARRHPAVAGRFIFLTSGISSPSTQRFIDNHGVPALQKPVAIKRLLDAVRRVAREEPRSEPGLQKPAESSDTDS